jgi:mannosyl-oligosaccharide alpha-1,2-mannosidase
MVGIAAKVFDRGEDMEVARRLMEGCLWLYENMPQGIMPELLHLTACSTGNGCSWSTANWHMAVNAWIGGEDPVEDKISKHRLPLGVAKIDDTRYILR